MNFQADKEYGLYVMANFNKVEREFDRLISKVERRAKLESWEFFDYNTYLGYCFDKFIDIFGNTPAYWQKLTEKQWSEWYEEMEVLDKKLSRLLKESYWGKLVARKVGIELD